MNKKRNGVAIYLRVSKGDKEERESSSIQNQRSLLLEFIQNQREWDECDILEFSDDGYSGLYRNRPAWMQLLEQVKEGMVSCIVVKDFSRFSRDYIELGTYLEQIFPFLGVRFISLNDGYDSENGGELGLNLEVIFQNLLYDWYSKDLSVKVISSFRARKEKGYSVCTRLPYGYRYGEKKGMGNPYGIEICKEEAEVVQMIFSLALQGKSLYEIAKLLNQKGISTQTAEGASGVLWRASTVWQILKNSFYIGVIVYNKYEKKKVGERSIQRAKEEWSQVIYKHLAIIEKEKFEEVQSRFNKKREKIQGNLYPLKGKILCGTCQRKLQRRNMKIPYFTCTTRYITESKSCVKRLEMDRIVSVIGQVFWQIMIFYQVIEVVKNLEEYAKKRRIKILKEEIKQVEKNRIQWERKEEICYKKYLFGMIKKEEYFEQKYQIKKRKNTQKNVEKRYHIIKNILKESEQKREENFLEAAENFIKRILVFEGKKIVVVWDFQKPEKEEDL